MSHTLEVEDRRWGSGAIDLNEKTLPSLKAMRALASLQDLPAGASVLDYGCGEGKLINTLKLHRPDLKYFGVDVQRPLNENPGFEFDLIVDEQCPMFSRQFDAILSLDVLEHVPDLEQTLARIATMLKPGGRFVLFVPAEGEMFSPFGFYRAILGKDVYVKTKSHVHAYRKKQILRLLDRYFSVRDVSYSYHVIGTLLDSTFFALTSLKGLARWFWKKNSMYHPENKKKGLLNRAMELANLICFAESQMLRSVAAFSSGLHVTALKK